MGISNQRTTALFFVLALLLSFSTYAAPMYTTYQAKIIKPDGETLEDANVNFQFTILSPLGNCILYTENFTAINMTGTGGLVSFSLGSGIKTFPTSGTVSFSDVFNNHAGALTCASGGPASYTPLAGDLRKIIMQFQDVNGWQTLPAMNINHIPYAMYAQHATSATTAVTAVNSAQLNGKTDLDFVQVTSIPTCSASQALQFNGASFGCVAVGSSGGASYTITSSDVITALGYTPQVSGAASSQWTTSGAAISFASGNVGIGTASPSYKLELSGTAVTDQKIGINDKQVLYLPDQANFTGSLFIGDGGGSLTHTSGSHGYYNTGAGIGALYSNTIGGYNTANGYRALYSNINGYENVANGFQALYSNINGYGNVATGVGALYSNISGLENVATGYKALYFNTEGSGNIAIGMWALYKNTTGGYNVATGESALNSNTTGNLNVANGSAALWSNTTGHFNVATGVGALQNNQTKSESTAIGYQSMYYADSVSAAPEVSYNTAIGAYSLYGSTTAADNTGTRNTALGHSTLRNLTSGSSNTAIGYNAGSALTTGSNNVIVGSDTGSSIATLSNYILFADGAGNRRMTINGSGYVGIGTTTPTAKLHLAAGTTSTAPFKFTSGTLLTSPQSGTMEYDGANFYLTDESGQRRAISTGSSSGTVDNASNVNSTGNIVMNPNGGANSVIVSSTVASTSSNTGALVVNGGLGVAGNIVTSSNIQGVSVTATGGIISPYIAGGINSSNNLTLDSTAHATKGNILLAPNGGSVGIGTTSPNAALDVILAGSSSYTGLKSNISSTTGNATGVDTFASGSNYSTGVLVEAESNGAAVGVDVYASVNSASGTYVRGLSVGIDDSLVAGSGLFLFANTVTAKESKAIHISSGYNAGYAIYADTNGKSYFKGNVGIGTNTPSAILHLSSGTSATASFKLTSGTLLTSPQAGAIEYDGTDYYFTDATSARRSLAAIAGAGVTSASIASALGYVPANDTAVTNSITTVSNSVTTLAGQVSSIQSSQWVSAAGTSSTSVAAGTYSPLGQLGTQYSVPTSGGVDDGYFTFALPFAVNFNGTSYSNIYIGTNSYITFDGGSTAYSGLSATNPSLNKITVDASDRASNSVWFYSDATSFSIRYEGGCNTTPGTSLVWELQGSSANVNQLNLQIISLCGGGVSMVADPVIALQYLTATAATAYAINYGISASNSNIYFTSGNVGIGVTAPLTKLAISGGMQLGMESASCGVNYAGTLRYNTGSVEFCNGTTWSGFTVSGTVASQWNTSGTTINYTAGNVGIGTTNPTAKLSVSGSLLVTDRIKIQGTAGLPAPQMP